METRASVHLAGPGHKRMIFKISRKGEFPGGPVVGTQHFHCQGQGLISGWGTKILQAVWCGQKKKKFQEGTEKHTSC